jgi:hypothetical protein
MGSPTQHPHQPHRTHTPPPVEGVPPDDPSNPANIAQQNEENLRLNTPDASTNPYLVTPQLFSNQISAPNNTGNNTAINSGVSANVNITNVLANNGYDATGSQTNSRLALFPNNPPVSGDASSNINYDLVSSDRSNFVNQLLPPTETGSTSPAYSTLKPADEIGLDTLTGGAVGITRPRGDRTQQIAQRPAIHRELDDNFSREDNSRALQIVVDQRNQITDAANEYNVSPQVMSAILFEEARRYGADDSLQDAALNTTLNFGTGTYGRAQMSGETLRGLLAGGYLDGAKHSIDGFNLRTQAEYNSMRPVQQAAYERDLLLSNAAAPHLIAAYSRQTIDNFKGRLPSIEQQPLNGRSVRDTNHYRILTQVYSTGAGVLEGSIESRGDSLRRYANMNARGIQAVSNFTPISEAYYGVVTPFQGAQYNTTPGGFGNSDY